MKSHKWIDFPKILLSWSRSNALVALTYLTRLMNCKLENHLLIVESSYALCDCCEPELGQVHMSIDNVPFDFLC